MDDEAKTGYDICKENNFPLAEYKILCGAEVPICTSKMTYCSEAGLQTEGVLICRGAIKRDMKCLEKEVTNG